MPGWGALPPFFVPWWAGLFATFALKHMKATYLGLLASLVCITAQAQHKTIGQRADSILHLMTLEEKIGQMNQYTGDWHATGPITADGDKQNQIRKGMLGSMLNVTGAAHTREVQEMAMQSRLKIPLLFGLDVIHGYRTTFPVPLAEAASWDTAAIRLSAHIAAKEAAAAGIHWTFAPMVDIARDPRWGRVMEGAGEDPFLGSQIAIARVTGFQGVHLGSTDAVMACAKHFAAYGAAVGGRDYNSVDMSDQTLWNIYLPPFKAAAEAGAATFMNSFNSLNGIPASGNAYLQRTILKGNWNFQGFVVSDWGSISEMVNHGYAKDNAQAAEEAVTAGSDMDMEGRAYIGHLADLVRSGKVKERLIDEAVKRILVKKLELGLFENPYKFCDSVKEQSQWNDADNLSAAKMMAEKSIVLLKNQQGLLPLSKQTKTIALIGPLMKSVRDNLGFWSFSWPDDTTRIITQFDGIKKQLGPDAHLLYAQGCDIRDTSTAGFADAVQAASQADVVVVSVGEAGNMSGEAKSRSNIHLPGVQEDLIKALVATGKPVVVLINAGRPLVFNWTADHAAAIVYTWFLGTEAGDAIADVLFGNYNPSGKLPISFPRSEGQIPIYYNHLNTGRPARGDAPAPYTSGYLDLPNSPQFPFGFGLSYTTFAYSGLTLDKTQVHPGQEIKVTVQVSNTGNYDGEETAQLYIRDIVSQPLRPIKELKAFQKVWLKKGETRELTFTLTSKDLSFYDNDLHFTVQPGDFKVFVGGSSQDVKEAGFTLLDQ
jgi:beta-glucosidase